MCIRAVSGEEGYSVQMQKASLNTAALYVHHQSKLKSTNWKFSESAKRKTEGMERINYHEMLKELKLYSLERKE